MARVGRVELEELLNLKIYKIMKKNLSIVLMCIGGCMLDSTGWAFGLACLLVGVPAIVMIVGELKKNNVNYDEYTLNDIETRQDMYEFV